MTLRDDDALAWVRERLERHDRSGDRDAVLGPGVMARAGRLWRGFLSPAGTSVEVAHVLARLHWSRDKALGLDAPVDELWSALLLFARIGEADPGLVPDEVRQLLSGRPHINHSFLGPEHWGRRAIRLLKEAQVEDADGRRLDEAVELFSGTTEAYEPGHEFWAGDMANLSLALRMRYEQRGDPADLESAERTARTALRAVHPGDSHLPTLLDNLSTALVARFSRTGDAVALAEALRLFSRALREMSPQDPRRRTVQENRAGAGLRRYDLTGDRAELDRSVDELSRLVAETPDNDRSLFRRRGLLGGALHTLFKCTGDRKYLHQAVESLTRAADSVPPGSSDRLAALTALSAALLTRFDETGSAQDLEDAVAAGEWSVEESAFDDPGRPARLHNWGQALFAAAEYTRRPQLLDRAVEVFRQAVGTLPPQAPQAPQAAEYTASLGRALMARQLGESFGEITPFGVTDLAADTARSQMERFRDEAHPETVPDAEELTDLTDAYEAQLRSVERARPGHPDRGTYLLGLSTTCYARHLLFGRKQDADQAVELARQAVDATPEDHPGHAEAVHRLAVFLAELDGAEGRERALSLWEGLVSLGSARPSVRARAAGDAARVRCRRGEWAAAVGHYSRALQIMPSLVSPPLERATQERLLTYWSGLSAEAASCAINAGEPDRALELLEQGRGVLWSQLLDARWDMSALEAVDAASAERLSRLERELNASPAAGSGERWWGRVADHRLTLAAERDELLAHVRSLPGLEGFRRPAVAGELRGAAADGPVAVVVSSQWRTDALIVTSDATRVVPLGNLDHRELLTRAHRYLTALAQYESGPRDAVARVKLNLVITSTLEWLWRDVADPVLTALGHTEPPADDRQRPRLWWCPTGPLALLPLHAAGLPGSGTFAAADVRVDAVAEGDGGPADSNQADSTQAGGSLADRGEAGCCVLDRVTPSYTPTLRALLASRGPTGGTAEPPERMLAVAMPTTPGHPPLPQVMEELAVLRAVLPRSTLLQGERATQSAVRDALRTHRWAHLSCHGGQDLMSPSQGGLVLHDGLLTVADLRADLYPYGEFVFMSACQTALGGATVPDEAITMASAFQYAGWRQVIGTLWSVGAATAAELSADLYGALVEDGELHAEGAAEALCRTVRRLRAEGRPPIDWAPFAHSGV